MRYPVLPFLAAKDGFVTLVTVINFTDCYKKELEEL